MTIPKSPWNPLNVHFQTDGKNPQILICTLVHNLVGFFQVLKFYLLDFIWIYLLVFQVSNPTLDFPDREILKFLFFPDSS